MWRLTALKFLVVLLCFCEYVRGNPTKQARNQEKTLAPRREGEYYLYDVVDQTGTAFTLRVTHKINNHTFAVRRSGKDKFLQRRNRCRMTGHVLGAPDSYVSLNTCGKLSGFVILENEEYKVMGNQLVLHKNVSGKKIPFKCGVKTGKIKHQMPDPSRFKQARPRDPNLDIILWVELFVVMDNKLFSSLGIDRDESKAVQYIEDVAFYADEIYKDTGVRVVLTGLEIVDHADSSENLTLGGELLYWLENEKAKQIRSTTSVSIDVIALITGTTFYGIAGIANFFTYCTQNALTVVMDVLPFIDFVAVSREFFSSLVLTHEIGHVLGMQHDHLYENCSCTAQSGICLLSSFQPANNLGITLSSCSRSIIEDIKEARNVLTCLNNAPDVVYGGPICGNGFKENGEECDCGKECDSSKCCTDLCELKPNARCSNEPCCHNCRVAKNGKVCRYTTNQCDIEDKCDGINVECPNDVYKHDSAYCVDDSLQGYCSTGRCLTRLSQCQANFGMREVKHAPPLCYMQNTLGNAYGNCGVSSDLQWQACNESDITCGLLWCDAKFFADYRRFGETASFFSLFDDDGNRICRAVSELDPTSNGLVKDFTPCSEENSNYVCYNQKCVDRKSLSSPGCPGIDNNCSGNGVCNNLGQCVCKNKYFGHDCSLKRGQSRHLNC